MIQFLCAGTEVETANKLARVKGDVMYVEEISVLGLAFEVMAGIESNELAGVEKWVYENSHSIDKIER